MGVPIFFVLDFLDECPEKSAFSIRVRPPESWHQGPVRRRLLRAFVKAYGMLRIEDLELVDENGLVVSRRAKTASEHLRVRRRREGRHFYSGAAWELVVGPPTPPGAGSFWSSRPDIVSPRERSARVALDRDPFSCEVAADLLEVLVEERRWAAAVDESLENEDLLQQLERGRVAAIRALQNAGYATEDVAKRFGGGERPQRRLLGRALENMKVGLLSEAQILLREAARHHPDDPRPAVWYARCRAMEYGLFGENLEQPADANPSLLGAIEELVPVSGFAETAALVALRARIENERERLWREKKHRDRLRKFGDDYHFPSEDINSKTCEEEFPREKTPYDILGISKEATAKEIRTAYRRKALETHPDRASTNNTQVDAALFREVHDAQLKLTDPDTRAQIDAEMREPVRKEVVVNSLRPRPPSSLWN